MRAIESIITIAAGAQESEENRVYEHFWEDLWALEQESYCSACGPSVYSYAGSARAQNLERDLVTEFYAYGNNDLIDGV